MRSYCVINYFPYMAINNNVCLMLNHRHNSNENNIRYVLKNFFRKIFVCAAQFIKYSTLYTHLKNQSINFAITKYIKFLPLLFYLKFKITAC